VISPTENGASQERILLESARRLVSAESRAILLVEDTAAHAAIIRRGLDPAIWQIEHVTRAKDALAAFTRDRDRIVLLDLSLPDVEGLDLLVELKSLSPTTPVIVVTSLDQVSTSVEAMRRGACDYVVKSDPKETADAIRQAIERAWIERRAAAEENLMEQTRLAQLVKAQRLEAIELVVRTVCHEVNNPLSGVVALSQLLSQNGTLSSDMQRLADGIFQSAKQVAEVVQKLRTVGDTSTDFGGRQILKIDE
jgi:DNA-binding response OmpR family regulator